MKYKGKRYKLITAANEKDPVCSVCAFVDINCGDAKQKAIEQDGKDCDEMGDYFIEDKTLVKKYKRKKLKFNNR